tara:strand:+ start:264 stop:440 length:177 start_codon:yes stop_codon:yes gene_type:complete
MDKEKLKLLVRNLELVVDNIKAEVLSDTSAYMSMDTYEEVKKSKPHDLGYDEIFEDDE